jgi:hypothetical protein
VTPFCEPSKSGEVFVSLDDEPSSSSTFSGKHSR